MSDPKPFLIGFAILLFVFGFIFFNSNDEVEEFSHDENQTHFILRDNDVLAEDFNQLNLTTDALWHSLNLSNGNNGLILPNGTKAVQLRLQARDNTVGAFFLIRKNGYVNSMERMSVETPANNIWDDNHGIVGVDENGFVEYNGQVVGWSSIRITIIGWYI